MYSATITRKLLFLRTTVLLAMGIGFSCSVTPWLFSLSFYATRLSYFIVFCCVSLIACGLLAEYALTTRHDALTRLDALNALKKGHL